MGWFQDQKKRAEKALNNFLSGLSGNSSEQKTSTPAASYGPTRPAAAPARRQTTQPSRSQSLAGFGYTPTKPPAAPTTPTTTYGPAAPAAAPAAAPTIETRSNTPILAPMTPLKKVDPVQALKESELGKDTIATGRFLKSLGSGLASAVGDYAAGEATRWAQNDSLLGGLTNPLGTVARAGRDLLVRPVARAGTSMVLSGVDAANRALGGKALASEIPAPVSPAGKFFLGNEPIKNYSQIAQESKATAETLGYGDMFSRFAAPFIGVGASISDIVPGIGGARDKLGKEVVENAVERAVKESAESLAERTVKAGAENAAETVARQIDDVAQKVILDIERASKRKLTKEEAANVVTSVERRIKQPQLNFPEGTAVKSAIEDVPARRAAEDAVAEVPDVKLPRSLAGAKPRFGFGPKQFVLDFANDIDKAAYITAQPKRSLADNAYLKFVEDATGMTEEQIRAHGNVVRGAIKDLARVADDSTPLKVPPIINVPKAPVNVPGKIPTPLPKPELPKAAEIPSQMSAATGYGDKSVVTSAIAGTEDVPQQGLPLPERPAALADQTAKEAVTAERMANPESVAPGAKDRGFVETVREATTTKPQVAERVSGSYSPERNLAQINEARQAIATDREAALTRALSTSSDIGEATQANVIAQELMREAQNAGNYDLAVQLAEKAAERGTKLGQAIQVYSLWGRMTPEGALKYASKLLDEASQKAKYAIKMDPKAAERIIVQGKRVETVGKIMDEAENLVTKGDFENAFKKFAEVGRGAARSDVSKVLAGADKFGKEFMSLDEVASAAKRQQLFEGAILARESASVVPASIGRKIASYQTMSLLLNVKTMLRNFVGNAGLAVAELGSDVVGSLIDLPLSKLTGRSTKALPNVAAQARGFVRGMSEGIAEARQGINLSGVNGVYDLGKQSGFTFKNPALRAGERTLGMLMRGPDRAFYQQAYDGTIAELQRLTGSLDITQEMQEVAHATGLYRTFQDETKLAQALELMKRGMNKLGTGDFGLGDAIIKFPKTPANVLNRGLAYSPAGFVRATWEMTKPLLTLGKNKFDQRAFVEATSRALVGTTGLVGTGYLLSQLGILTGKKENDKDIQQLRRESGLGEYRLNTSALKRFFLSGFNASEARPQVGDNVMSYEWFQPAALSLAIGANIAQNKGESNGFAGAIAAAAQDSGNLKFLEALVESVSIVEDQPMLVGLKRLFQKGSIGEGVLDALTAMPATFIPTIVNQVRQVVDPYSREYVTSGDEAFGLGGVLKTGVNQVINRIPGASETLPKKFTVFGEEKLAYPAGNDLKSVFITPWYKDVLYLTPESAMVLGIYDQTGETVQAPRVVDRSQEAYGSSFKLTNEQVSKMQHAVGTATKNIYNTLASNANFMTLPDDEKAKMLADVLSDVNTSVRAAPYIESLGVTYPSQLPFAAAKDLLDDLNKDDRFKNGTDEQKAQVLNNIFSQMKFTSP